MSRRPLPTLHQLGAAIVAATVLDPGGTPNATAAGSYLRVPTGGIYGINDLHDGQRLLVACGLVVEQDKTLYLTHAGVRFRDLDGTRAAEVLLSIFLEREPPLWMAAAVQGDTVFDELVPDRDGAVLAEVFTDPGRREALLLRLAQRFDPIERQELGAAGETVVVEQCRCALIAGGRPELASGVVRVSEVSDQLGYDITSPKLRGGIARLEVKTSGRLQDYVDVYVSRNEALTGARDPHWALVVCARTAAGDVELVGWMPAADFVEHLPYNRSPTARWESARLTIAMRALRPGLPLDA